MVADLESVKWGRGGNAHRKGKPAVTNYEVREAFGDAAVVGATASWTVARGSRVSVMADTVARFGALEECSPNLTRSTESHGGTFHGFRGFREFRDTELSKPVLNLGVGHRASHVHRTRIAPAHRPTHTTWRP